MERSGSSSVGDWLAVDGYADQRTLGRALIGRLLNSPPRSKQAIHVAVMLREGRGEYARAAVALG